jgi:hypothetical protein
MTQEGFAFLRKLGEHYAKSFSTPERLRGKVEDCASIVQWAREQGVNPTMAIQNAYVIGAKLAFETKFVIALVNSRRPFQGGIEYTMSGDEGTMARKCTASAVTRDGRQIEFSVSLQDAKNAGWWEKKDSMWKKIPELMLRYRSAMYLVRTHCPEVVMGVATRDELDDAMTVDAPAANVRRVDTIEQLTKRLEETAPDWTREQREEGFRQGVADTNEKFDPAHDIDPAADYVHGIPPEKLKELREDTGAPQAAEDVPDPVEHLREICRKAKAALGRLRTASRVTHCCTPFEKMIEDSAADDEAKKVALSTINTMAEKRHEALTADAQADAEGDEPKKQGELV